MQQAAHKTPTDGRRKALSVGVFAAGVLLAGALGKAWGAAKRFPARWVAPAEVAALAKRWATVFPAVPAQWVRVVVRVESQGNANAVNDDARAKRRGNAWGLMGVTALTAQDGFKALRGAKNPLVRATLAGLADETADGALRDPNVNVMLGTWYLDQLIGKVGKDFDRVLTSYQQGPGPVQKALANREPWDAYVGPHGRVYLQMAQAARKAEA